MFTYYIMTSYFEEKQIFYINSRNRLTGTDTEFTYHIPINHTKGYDKVVVLDISIPKSYYIIPQSGHEFTLTENGTDVLIDLTAGNYNRTSLMRAVGQALTTHSPNGYTYTITYQNINNTVDSGKITITCSNTSTPISLTFTLGMYEQLGFNVGTVSFVSGVLTSPNVINLNFETTLFLQSNICTNEQDNILQNIITTGSPDYTYIVWNNSCPKEYSKDLTTGASNIYSFAIYNEQDILMNTNGLNVVITIMLYKSSNIDKLIKNYIKLNILENIPKK